MAATLPRTRAPDNLTIRELRMMSYDGTIQLGHIIQAIGLIFLGGVGWAQLHGTIALVETRLESQTVQNRLRIEALDGRVAGDLRNIDRRLTEILERMGEKPQ